MTNLSRPHFVWWKSSTSIEPQKWGELEYGVSGWKRQYVVACHELSDELATLSIDALVEIYPCPRT